MPRVSVWIHCVWSTKNRTPTLNAGIRPRVLEHIQTNAVSKGICLDVVGGFCDHVHVLISLRPDKTLAQTIQLIKGESSHWINQSSLIPGRFEWQTEYYAVSIAEQDLGAVRAYIRDQEEHHRKKSFAEECQAILPPHLLRHED